MTESSFAQRAGWIWLDGAFAPWRDAQLHVLSHGLHYASAVFEGARMYDGEVFALAAHAERLANSAALLDMTLPYTVAEIAAAIDSTCRRNGLSNAYVRPIAWRGSETMGVAGLAARVHVAVAAWEWPDYFDPRAAAGGVRLAWARYRRPSPETQPVHAKASGLYMICTICKQAAEREGFADALMLDYRGYVAEATGANVFFVRDGALHTPTADCFLDGITRRAVIALARERRIPIIERHINPEELAGFSECFLTGSAAEITPVASIGEISFATGRVTAALREAYAQRVRRHRAA